MSINSESKYVNIIQFTIYRYICIYISKNKYIYIYKMMFNNQNYHVYNAMFGMIERRGKKEVKGGIIGWKMLDLLV